MARMPGAIWRPLADNWNKQPRMRAWDIFCLHTMVGTLDGTDGYFRNSAANGPGYAGTESHFGVGPDGTIYQWQDTDFQAEANGAGNDHVISSENADMGAPFPKWGGSDVPAFTPQQIEANAQIAAWCQRTHGIPLDPVPDSRRGRRGMAYHRLGVPRNKGDRVSQTGGELWSSSAGKVCPGDRRIAQVPQVRSRAIQIASGVSQEEKIVGITFDSLEQFQTAVNRAVWASSLPDRPGPWPIDRLAGIDDKTGNLGHMVQRLLGDEADGVDRLGDLWEQADRHQQEVLEAVGQAQGGLDVKAFGEALRPVLLEAVREGMAADNDATAEEIVDRLADRLNKPAT
jgi:hypothetical protein